MKSRNIFISWFGRLGGLRRQAGIIGDLGDLGDPNYFAKISHIGVICI